MAIFKILVKNGADVVAKEIHSKSEDELDSYKSQQESDHPTLTFTKYKEGDSGYSTFETDHTIDAADPRVS